MRGQILPLYVYIIYVCLWAWRWAALLFFPAPPQMLFIPAVSNDSIYIQSLTGSEKITLTVYAIICILCCPFLFFCHPALLSGSAVPERVNLMALSPWRKNPFVAKKEKEREREKEGMRNHLSARRNPLSVHVFPLGSLAGEAVMQATEC